MRLFLNFILFILPVIAIISPSFAMSRHFPYSYEANSKSSEGRFEYVSVISFRGDRNPGRYLDVDFRNEGEYGISRKLSTAVYLDYGYLHSNNVVGLYNRDDFTLRGVSSVWKYQIADHMAKKVGFMVYLEPGYRTDKKFSLQERAVLSIKAAYDCIVAVNLAFQHEWNFQNQQTSNLKMIFSGGFAHQINKRWWAGLELRVRSEFPSYSRHNYTLVSMGPYMHFEKGNVWFTLGLMPQITTSHGYDKIRQEFLEAKALVGVNF